jgi:hypothetical protein
MYANDDILLIDKELIFKYTQLGGNVDVDKIYPFVKIAQDIQVQELLGTKLYRYILTQVEAGTLTGNYQTLVSHYVQPMLIHYAMADLLLFHGYEVTNAGILRNSPENTPCQIKANWIHWFNAKETSRKLIAVGLWII